jgi:predicted nucleotidyltransferase
MALPPEIQAELDRVLDALKSRLGENLHACAIYGSAVRGGFVPATSDINLLIVLKESTPEAHASVAAAIAGDLRVEPFVLPLAGLERSVQSFVAKFDSIRRAYRVLHGADPLAGVAIDGGMLKFLSEQSLRNLHLRLVRAFIVHGRDGRRYAREVLARTAAVFSELSQVVRISGTDVTGGYPERIALLERTFGAETAVLHELLKLKQEPRRLSYDEASQLHGRLMRLLNRAVQWVEERWPRPPRSTSD